MRFLSALTISLLLASFFPGLAVAGICAQLPCCADQGEMDSSISRPDCCTRAQCTVEQPELRPQMAQLTIEAPEAGELFAATYVPDASLHSPADVREVWPPAHSARRLAVLSTFLI